MEMNCGRKLDSNELDWNSTGWFVEKAKLINVKWKSNNKKIATVNFYGKVTGISEGTTTITAEHNGEIDEYDITVTSNPDATTITMEIYIKIIIMIIILIIMSVNIIKNKKKNKLKISNE